MPLAGQSLADSCLYKEVTLKMLTTTALTCLRMESKTVQIIIQVVTLTCLKNIGKVVYTHQTKDFSIALAQS